MNFRKLILVLSCLIICSVLSAAAAKEGGGSNRGTYLSNGGYIILPQDIFIDAYIAERDYNYALPSEDEIAAITAIGEKDGVNYIMLGLKGKKELFENIKPLNVCFCIDRSGSMSGVMPWVKDSFYIFIDSIRDGDIISLVDMNTDAQVLIPPTTINCQEDREQFKRAVDRIQANGGTNVFAGMQKSYEQLEEHNTDDYINRVIILTDGMHNYGTQENQDIINLAVAKRKDGISISTIMLGIQTATGLMTDVAEQGGGSSRFISNHDEMVKIFRTELDRMLIPVAREVSMKLELNDGVTVKETWGYQNSISGNTVNYFLPAMHNGDYETVCASLELSESFTGGEIGTYTLTYLDLEGNEKELGPYTVYPAVEDGSGLIRDERIREIEAIIYYTKVLSQIGENSLNIQKLESDVRRYANQPTLYNEVLTEITPEILQNLELINGVRSYLQAVDESLGGGKFAAYYTTLANYQETFSSLYAKYQPEYTTY